jgi:tRNA 2-thiouridine synthesizing protein A
MPDVSQTLDASGLACPMPVVRTKQAIDKLEPGQVLEVISTDRGSLQDIPAWAGSTGNRVIEANDGGDRFTFLIEKS